MGRYLETAMGQLSHRPEAEYRDSEAQVSSYLRGLTWTLGDLDELGQEILAELLGEGVEG